MKSEKFFDIETPAPRKTTPSLTSMVCAHWRTLGPAWEADDELARSGIERIHRDSPRSWVRAPGGGWPPRETRFPWGALAPAFAFRLRGDPPRAVPLRVGGLLQTP